MLRRLIVSMSILLLTPTVLADSLNLNLNDDAVRLTFAKRLANPKLMFDVGWLHNQDRGDVGTAGFYLADLASGGANPVRAGIGGRLAYMDADSGGDGLAVGIGGFFSYTLTQWDRVIFGGHLYFAPDILSFSGAEEYLDAEARVGYSVLRDAQVYIGARTVKGEFKNAPNVTFDNGLNIGIEISF